MASEPFLGELAVYSFAYAPRGWAECNGQLLPINQNQALFSLLGTMYGGDGRVNFALPDLRGRTPFHIGGPTSMVQGARGGAATHTLSVNELPAHSHTINASAATGSQTSLTTPAGTFAVDGGSAAYGSVPDVAMQAGLISSVGGGQPHENRPPYLVLNVCIALQGVFPSRN